MRIKIGTLRVLLREMAMSPSVFKNNKPRKDPMQGKVISGMQAIQGGFQNMLLMNLVLLHGQEHFEPVTRDGEQSGEFNDKAYAMLKVRSQQVAEELGASLQNVIEDMWVKGNETD